MNAANILAWARAFIVSVQDLTANDRKVLLTSDCYRSHMSLAVLELLHANGNVAYALPAHTSGKTQPCDCVLFGAYKEHLNKWLAPAGSVSAVDSVDIYNYCAMMAQAYDHGFAKYNIRASSRRTELWPVDGSRLLSVPRPRSAEDVGTIVGVEELQTLLDGKHRAVSASALGSDARIDSSGFIDTRSGAVLTAGQALALTQAKAQRENQSREAKRLRAMRAELARSRRQRVARLELDRLQSARWKKRARLGGVSVSALQAAVRPMAERRAPAKIRCTLRCLQ